MDIDLLLASLHDLTDTKQSTRALGMNADILEKAIVSIDKVLRGWNNNNQFGRYLDFRNSYHRDVASGHQVNRTTVLCRSIDSHANSQILN